MIMSNDDDGNFDELGDNDIVSVENELILRDIS